MAAAALVGCVDQPEPTRHGLPAVHLLIAPSDVARMRAGTFTKTGVAGEVWLGGDWRNGTISVAGNSTVDDLKKSYNLDLDLGDHDRRRYRLNAMSRDPSALRGLLAFRLHELAGLDSIDGDHVSVTVNGDDAGLYLLHPVIDADRIARGGDRAIAIYSAQKSRADMTSTANLPLAFDADVGDESYADLRELIERVLTGSDAELAELLDVDRATRYMAVAGLIGNRDGIDNNYRLVRSQREPRFRFWPWDVDFTFHSSGTNCGDALFDRNALMARLRDDPTTGPAYRALRDELDGPENRAILLDLLDRTATEIATAHALDPLLGGRQPLDGELMALQELLARPLCERP